MGIHIYALSTGLLKKHFQIPQIVAGYQDAGTVSCAGLYPGDLRIAVSLCVCLIQKSHALYPVFSGFQGQGSQLRNRKGVI